MSAILRHTPLLAVSIVAVVVFGVLRPSFLSISGFLDIGQQVAVTAVLAFALTAVIIARGIDISVGSTVSVSGVMGALTLTWGLPAPLAVAVCVLTGAVIGILNGVLIGLLHISPLIATLGTMAFGSGAALALSGASSIAVDETAMLMAGGGYVGPVPASVVIAAVLAVCWILVLRSTLYGRWIYAVGGNDEAARASLVPARWVRLSTYVLAGASAGLGAVIMIGRVGSAQPMAGQGLEFAAITAAVVGGAKLSGGSGTIVGTALGAVFIGIVNSGLSFLAVPQQVTYVITGSLVIIAVLATQSRDLRGMVVAVRRGLANLGDGLRRTAGPSSEHRLELDAVGKSFPGVRALHQVSFAISSGEVVALVGENGAGKSTLVKTLAGAHEPDAGRLVLDGTPLRLRTSEESRAAGVSVIHQHLSLLPDLTVLENLFLGREEATFGVLHRRRMRGRAQRALGQLDLEVDLDARLGGLSLGQRQLLEIAKAMLDDSWLIIMDEPTSALSNREREQLYATIDRLMERGIAILYISHRMEEVYRLAGRAVVLRDGEFVDDVDLAAVEEPQLISMMVGREVGEIFAHRQREPGDELLHIEGVSDGSRLQEATLSVRAGEIVGLAGLMGSGRSEVLRCIAGLSRRSAGRVVVAGDELASGSPAMANDHGVAYVPEERLREGIVPEMSVRDNIALAWLRRHARFGLIPRGVGRLVDESIERLRIRPPMPGRQTGLLSGGNQQKVLLARWLATEPQVLLLDEPTNGVDVGSKAEIHALIADLKQRGIAVLLVSSELPELLGVADRIYVMRGGRVAGELARGASEEEVMQLAFEHQAVPAPG